MRAGLLRHAPGRAIFFLCIHHILADGQSLSIIVQELLDHLAGQEPTERPLPFGRMVAEEQAYLQSAQASMDRDYWLGILTPPPPPLDLPTDFPRPPAKRHEGARIGVVLPQTLVSALNELARQTKASFFTMFLALVKTLLFRRSGQGDLVVGLPVSTRTQRQHEGCVGFCVNTVAVRSAPSPELTFLDYLASVREAVTGAMEHGAYPFDLVYRGLALPRDPARSPLFDVMVVFDPVGTEPMGNGSLSLSALDLDFRVSKFDLTFLCAKQPDGSLRLSLDYDTDLFLPAIATAMLKELAGLCQEVAIDPGTVLGRPGQVAEPRILAAALPDPASNAVPEARPDDTPGAKGQALQAVLQAWRDILGRDARPQDDFFALGGDSIKAIQVCGRLRKAGWNAGARGLFEHPTPTAFANRLEQGPSLASDHCDAPKADEPSQAPLTPLQSWLWRDHPQAMPGFYMDLLVTTPPGLDPDRLEAALLAVARRQDALRTVFEDQDGQPRQRLGDAARLWWETRDLTASHDVAQAVKEVAPALQARIDPRRGRHLAAAFLRAPSQGYLYLVAHHLAVDGLSWRIILEDLATAYADGPAALPQPPATFMAWAQALHQHAASPTLLQELAYWRGVAATPSAPLPSPAPGQPVTDQLGQGDFQWLSAGIASQDLGGLASPAWRERGLRPSDLRLAALGLALGRVLPASPNQASMLVALEGHGREPSVASLDLSRTVGWFTCEYPLALPISASSDPVILAESLRQTLRAVPRGGVGFGLLAQAHGDLHARCQIGFNDHGLALPGGPFTLAPASLFPRQARPLPDAPPLSLSLIEDKGHLQVEIMYRADSLDPAWVASLLKAYVSALTELAAGPGGPLEAQPGQTLPLTPAQAGMYFQYLADPGSRTYAQQIALHLHGPAETEALGRAWRHTAARHQALRAVFAQTTEGPVQTILSEPPHVWTQVDLSSLPEAARQRELEALLHGQRELPLDIEQGPTLRACLARLGPEEHVLVWSFHHILMDGWCTAILLNETLAAHQALRQGHAPQMLPAPPLRPYLDWLAAHDPQADRAYWRAQLEKFTEPSPLGRRSQTTAKPGGEYRPREMSFSLGRQASQSLREVAASLAVTQSALIQAAWGLLLARHCDLRDVVFGVVTSGREAELEGMERLVGVFIHTLPVRVRLDDPEETVASLARRLHGQAARRLPHETLHLADIQALTPLGKDLFDHLLLFESYPSQVSDSDLRLGQVSGFEQLPYDLGLAILPGPEITFRFSFNEAVYSSAFVEGLGRRWLALLGAVLEAPHSAALSLPALPADEARHLTRWARITRREWPDPRPLPFLFAERAALEPKLIALVTTGPDGPRQVSYGELAARVGQLAEWLAAQGAGPNEPVAVCLGRGPDLPAALLAVQAVGAAYVPLDPLYPPERLAYILKDSGARLLLAETATAGVLGQATPPGLRTLLLDQTPWGPHAPWPPLPGPDDLAYIIYTSGSTGQPKGVEVTHKGLTNFLWSMAREPGLTRDDTLLAVTTVCFDIAGLELFLPLILGARIVLASREEAADAQRLMALLEQHQVSVLQATPTTWSMLVETGWPGRPGLKALVGGEALSPRLAEDMLSRCQEVWNLYGPTETTIWSTVRRVLAAEQGPPLVTIGTPLANTTAYVLGRDLTLLPEGVVGELCLGGHGLARGYRNLPELTAQRFVNLPFAPFERIYRTGDLAAWTEQGELTYLGRSDFQVKVRGFRIELGEVENRLTAMTGVSQAVVQAGDYRGAGTELAAWIIASPELTDHDIRQRLLRNLPDYMVPGLFVRLAQMPLTPNSKIDRKSLPNPLSEDPPVATSGQALAQPGMASREALDLMTGIWRDILRLGDLNPGDNFFHRGGHSLLAMRLVAAIERSTGIRLPLRAVFDHPTLEAQAEMVSRDAGQGRLAIGQSLQAPDSSLSPDQHQVQTLQSLSPEGLTQSLEGDRLAEAVPFSASQRQRGEEFGGGTLSEEELSLLRDMVDE
jgi:amino acid adenylation domain-containing protein